MLSEELRATELGEGISSVPGKAVLPHAGEQAKTAGEAIPSSPEKWL